MNKKIYNLIRDLRQAIEVIQAQGLGDQFIRPLERRSEFRRKIAGYFSGKQFLHIITFTLIVCSLETYRFYILIILVQRNKKIYRVVKVFHLTDSWCLSSLPIEFLH